MKMRAPQSFVSVRRSGRPIVLRQSTQCWLSQQQYHNNDSRVFSLLDRIPKVFKVKVPDQLLSRIQNAFIEKKHFLKSLSVTAHVVEELWIAVSCISSVCFCVCVNSFRAIVVLFFSHCGIWPLYNPNELKLPRECVTLCWTCTFKRIIRVCICKCVCMRVCFDNNHSAHCVAIMKSYLVCPRVKRKLFATLKQGSIVSSRRDATYTLYWECYRILKSNDIHRIYI